MLQILSRTVETLNSGQDSSVADPFSDPNHPRIRIQIWIRFQIHGIDDLLPSGSFLPAFIKHVEFDFVGTVSRLYTLRLKT